MTTFISVKMSKVEAGICTQDADIIMKFKLSSGIELSNL
jgi:hypothetical protein